MRTDVVGKVRNTNIPKSKPLYPLFEAISNAMHGIEDAKKVNGKISITIVRDKGVLPLSDDIAQITGFIIKDNGIGFDAENWDSFRTAESTYKLNRGARGIGRFAWLKGFEKAIVESIYKENSSFFKRSFEFVLKGDGVENLQNVPINEERPYTIIELRQVRADWQKNYPRQLEDIGRQIIYHFLAAFLLRDCPQIDIKEEDGEGLLNLNKLFENEIKVQSKNILVHVKKEDLQVTILKNYGAATERHTVSYCANKREVETKNISTDIPDLKGKMTDNEDNSRKFVWQIYVSGQLLDENVNSERTQFNLLKEERESDNELFLNEVSLADIHKKIVETVETQLADYLNPLRDEKKKFVEEYIHSEAPQYLPVLKYSGDDFLRQLAFGLSKEKLDFELYKEMQRLERRNKQEVKQFLNKKVKDIIDFDEYNEEMQKHVEQVNDIGKSQLARYIMHRRVIMEFLEKQISVGDNGKFALEQSVHNIIFPIRQTSDDITYEKQNLWLIDERLAYHWYLSSDRPFNKISAINSDSKDRPDILIFNKTFAFVDTQMPFQSVVLIEFKRPMRDQYDEDEDPLLQIYGYINEIIEGQAGVIPI